MDSSRADAPPAVRLRPEDPPGAALPTAPAQPVADIANSDLPLAPQPESQRGTFPEITEAPEAVTLAFRPVARAPAPHQDPHSTASTSSDTGAPVFVLPDKAASIDGDGSASADART